MGFDRIISVLPLLLPLTVYSQTTFAVTSSYRVHIIRVLVPNVLSNNYERSTLLILHHRGYNTKVSVRT